MADQLNSLAAQVSHYQSLLNQHPEWELADIYADGPVRIGLNPKQQICGPAYSREIIDLLRNSYGDKLRIFNSIGLFVRLCEGPLPIC